MMTLGMMMMMRMLGMVLTAVDDGRMMRSRRRRRNARIMAPGGDPLRRKSHCCLPDYEDARNFSGSGSEWETMRESE